MDAGSSGGTTAGRCYNGTDITTAPVVPRLIMPM